MYDALSNFHDAIRAAGLEPPDVIEPGKLHRFPGSGKHPSNRAGWCLLFDDGLGGCFGDWSSGVSETWQAKRDKPYSRAERTDFSRRMEEAKKRATVQAAVTLRDYNKPYGDLDLSGLIESLAIQTRASADGDLKRAEGMLTAQAHTLDAIFNNLARRAINAQHMDNLDRCLKLALRAQSQSRATWEALATIKNPPVAGYVRQANIAHGPQQVNNTSATPDGTPRARENPNLQDKLLEEKDGERLDPGTKGTTGRADPAMATVGEVDRAEDQSR